MATLPKLSKKLSMLLHLLGLSSLGSALFLETTVFTSILQFGSFSGVEQNHFILTSELSLTCFGIGYLAYLFLRFILPSQ
ncbi:MAG TPA: hypothetical protein VK536_09870 [Candidatus Limnocylindrales bacterium]|nr:hypothetical protein [Candidatus Limnocylindrales bacterium]